VRLSFVITFDMTWWTHVNQKSNLKSTVIYRYSYCVFILRYIQILVHFILYKTWESLYKWNTYIYIVHWAEWGQDSKNDRGKIRGCWFISKEVSFFIFTPAPHPAPIRWFPYTKKNKIIIQNPQIFTYGSMFHRPPSVSRSPTPTTRRKSGKIGGKMKKRECNERNMRITLRE
jgi:hypothetical protein